MCSCSYDKAPVRLSPIQWCRGGGQAGKTLRSRPLIHRIDLQRNDLCCMRPSASKLHMSIGKPFYSCDFLKPVHYQCGKGKNLVISEQFSHKYTSAKCELGKKVNKPKRARGREAKIKK